MKIYIIAGEASGDTIGAYLLDSISDKHPDTIIRGIGGAKMTEAGLKSQFPMQELSLFGFFEILPHIKNIKRRIAQTIADITAFAPDIVLTIDSPGFCTRVTAPIRKMIDAEKITNCKLIHYVAPTVWVYKEHRAEKFAKIYDKLLLILPFERPYFTKVGLDSVFVGHPVAQLPISDFDFIKNYHIAPNAVILSVMVGSRKSEIKKMLPIFIKTIKRLKKTVPNLNVVFLAMPEFSAHIQRETVGVDIPIYVVSNDEHRRAAIAQSHIALAKSGTGSLEISANNIPCVIAYKMNILSYMIIKSMMKVKFVNLINVISGREIIPELIQLKCKPRHIAKALTALIDDKSLRAKHIADAHDSLLKMGVGKGNPSDIACDEIFNINEE